MKKVLVAIVLAFLLLVVNSAYAELDYESFEASLGRYSKAFTSLSERAGALANEVRVQKYYYENPGINLISIVLFNALNRIQELKVGFKALAEEEGLVSFEKTLSESIQLTREDLQPFNSPDNDMVLLRDDPRWAAILDKIDSEINKFTTELKGYLRQLKD